MQEGHVWFRFLCLVICSALEISDIVLQYWKMTQLKVVLLTLIFISLTVAGLIPPTYAGPAFKMEQQLLPVAKDVAPLDATVKDEAKQVGSTSVTAPSAAPVASDSVPKITSEKTTVVTEKTEIILPSAPPKDTATEEAKKTVTSPSAPPKDTLTEATIKGGIIFPPGFLPKIPPIPYPIPLPKIPILPPIPPIPPVKDQQKQVAGVIISFHNGYTYDGLFSSVKQESKQGSVVLTYLTEVDEEKAILQGLNGNYTNVKPKLRALLGDIEKLSEKCASCVVFNWECSSGYSSQTFPNEGKYVFGLVELIIARGYLAMFSDFSLKALINQWDSKVLGPNPFVKVGETSTTIQLKFNKDRLLRSPSTQLQAVAHLAASDELSVHVLGGTIKYAVDSRVQPKGIYELEVLTVASNFPASQPYYQSKVDRYTGLAGHVLLSYKPGGKILTSMGHWIELMKLSTTEQKLFDTAAKLYGEAQLNKIKQEYAQLQTQQDKLQYQAQKSVSFIMNQSPGANAMQMSSIKV